MVKRKSARHWTGIDYSDFGFSRTRPIRTSRSPRIKTRMKRNPMHYWNYKKARGYILGCDAGDLDILGNDNIVGNNAEVGITDVQQAQSYHEQLSQAQENLRNVANQRLQEREGHWRSLGGVPAQRIAQWKEAQKQVQQLETEKQRVQEYKQQITQQGSAVQNYNQQVDEWKQAQVWVEKHPEMIGFLPAGIRDKAQQIQNELHPKDYTDYSKLKQPIFTPDRSFIPTGREQIAFKMSSVGNVTQSGITQVQSRINTAENQTKGFLGWLRSL